MAEIIVRNAESEDAKQLSALLGELGYPNTSEFAGEKIASIATSDSDILLVVGKREDIKKIKKVKIEK